MCFATRFAFWTVPGPVLFKPETCDVNCDCDPFRDGLPNQAGCIRLGGDAFRELSHRFQGN